MSNILQIFQDHFDDPFHRGICEQATHAAECASEDCTIRVETAIDDAGVVIEAWFDGAGCSQCEGLASMLMEYVQGKDVSELGAITSANLVQLLKIHATDTNQLAKCWNLPLQTLQESLQAPLVDLDDDLADGTQFGGQSLREEC